MAGRIIYTEASQLPKVGDGYEREVLDLKQTGKGTSAFHFAKDVAAFANHLGGTLLVGAEEHLGRVKEYHPLSEADVSAVQSTISMAVRDRCSPHPVVEPARIPYDGRFILAVNVAPELSALVGVSVTALKSKDGYGT